ncbi:MAG: polysaccharide biosynthesis protein [Thermoanaerobaculia bacterium]|nr:polysaccharide biosynthesis protein [Thermoanaerobaculia bacterium]
MSEPAETNPTNPTMRRLLTLQVQFALDLCVLVAAFVASYLFRFEFAIPADERRFLVTQLPYVVLLQFVALYLSGVYAFIWRYVGLREARAFVIAIMSAAVPVVILRSVLPDAYHAWRVPLSVAIADAVVAAVGILALRIARRTQWESAQRRLRAVGSALPEARPVLLIGAGEAGVMVAREIERRGDLGLDVRGFVDDDRSKADSRILGIRVVGTTEDLPRLVREMEIDHVVISIAQAPRQQIRRIVAICEAIPVRVQIIPGLFEILQGRVAISRLRNVEIEDLLGREQVELDTSDVRQFLSGRVVMVTGAGGSIGSELARQVAALAPSRLLLVERAEFVLFDIDREIRAAFPGLPVEALVADAGDEPRMRAIFETWHPAVVVHAAAHKHVPLMELNPCEAIKNNVLATQTTAQLAGEFGAEAFVLISTDKAVRPTSVMGASKRVAELVVQDLFREHPGTRFVVVRFGNVMGSTGSVIPIFREQIKKGGPVTVTDPEMVRFFMTIPEASQLVLQAGAMGQGGEIFVLDMGEPVRIVDLANEMIRLSGLVPGEDIEIVFTGVRPGEKLYEELGHDHETLVKTRHPKIFIGDLAPMSPAALEDAVVTLGEAAFAGEDSVVRERLASVTGMAADPKPSARVVV